MGAYHCRCTRTICQARQTKAMHPDEYVRAPRCKRCGKGRLRIDKFRNTGREHAGKTCHCCGYSFPHRRGSKWCEHNPALTADMLRERYESGRWS